MDNVNGGSSFVYHVSQNLLDGERKSGPSKQDLQGDGSPGGTGT